MSADRPMIVTEVAAIQMCSTANMQANLNRALRLIKEAVKGGAKLVVLPENFALLGAEDMYQAGITEAENVEPVTVRKWLAKTARQEKVWIIAGSIPMACLADGEILKSKVRAVCLVINDMGDEVARYDKIHLFDVNVNDEYGCYLESETVQHGDQLVVVDTPCGKVGLSICYDLRFPELFSQLRQQGAEIISVPSAFTATTGQAHWEILLRARAIETQCYFVAPNQTGHHFGARYSYGHSMIIDPWGRVLDKLAKQHGVVAASIDLSLLKHIRGRMPMAQQHRLTF